MVGKKHGFHERSPFILYRFFTEELNEYFPGEESFLPSAAIPQRKQSAGKNFPGSVVTGKILLNDCFSKETDEKYVMNVFGDNAGCRSCRCFFS